MSPVVRVDDDVWEWLKTLARPLEDTPNSVLRRVARIDPPLERAAESRRAGGQATSTSASTAPRGRATRDDDAESDGPALEPGTRRMTGEWLNRAFRLDARHALYHKDGKLYERLVRFPGVLCDRNGSVRFEDEEQFVSDPNLTVGDKVNVPQGLASHPRYQRLPGVAQR